MNSLWIVLAAACVGAFLTFAGPLGRSPGGRSTRSALRAALFLLAWLALIAATLFHRETATGPRVLLTEGSNEVAVRALEVRAPGRVVALDGRDWTGILPTIESRRDLAAWLAESQDPSAPVEVLGWGLHAWDWTRLDLAVSRFEPPSPATGITEIAWPRELQLGAPLEVVGRLSAEGLSQVRLIGPAGEEAATEIDGVPAAGSGAAPEATWFRLQAVPRTTGRLIYELEVDSPGQGPSRREIAVWVRQPSLPAVLWLEAAPTFESRAVRDWLTALGAPVAVSSQISRGRSRWQYANLERGASVEGEVSTGDLSRFDLLVVDPPSWRRLSRSAREEIETEVRGSGLGILVLTDPETVLDGTDLPLRGFAVEDGPNEPPHPLHLSWDEAAPGVPPLVGSGQGWRIDDTILPLVFEEGGSTVVAWRQMGAGRVAASRLRETYPWILGGEATHHRSFWSRILEELARPLAGERWSWRSGPVLLDQPLDVSLETAESKPEIDLVEPSDQRSRLAAWQELDGWRLTLHPREAGWHRLETADSGTWFFVSRPDAWMDWDRAARTRATEARRVAVETLDADWPKDRLFAVLGILLLALVWADERLAWSFPRGTSQDS
ncbi:MAG: hypothetical protein K8J08_10435 [Thermoanaerobaculia bacterium]|nr:hypothetical protein [Thermoanaerobaculia bacterium]